jgi:hypothetical protein
VKLSITVETLEGDRTTVVVTPGAIILWERATKRRLSDLAEGVAMEDMARLAWEQLRLEKVTALSFDDWWKTLADVEEPREVPFDRTAAGA